MEDYVDDSFSALGGGGFCGNATTTTMSTALGIGIGGIGSRL